MSTPSGSIPMAFISAARFSRFVFSGSSGMSELIQDSKSRSMRSQLSRVRLELVMGGTVSSFSGLVLLFSELFQGVFEAVLVELSFDQAKK